MIKVINGGSQHMFQQNLGLADILYYQISHVKVMTKARSSWHLERFPTLSNLRRMSGSHVIYLGAIQPRNFERSRQYHISGSRTINYERFKTFIWAIHVWSNERTTTKAIHNSDLERFTPEFTSGSKLKLRAVQMFAKAVPNRSETMTQKRTEKSRLLLNGSEFRAEIW